MFKIKNHLSPKPLQELFQERNIQHDLRNERSWENDLIRTVQYGSETVRNLGPKTWDLVPKQIQNSVTLKEFKIKIKTWVPRDCTCRN